MNAIRPFYHFHFFVRHNVLPTPDMLSLLLERFKGFLPFAQPVPDAEPGTPFVRLLQAQREDTMREILFEPEKIVIMENYKNGETSPSRDAFVDFVVETLRLFFRTPGNLLDNSGQGFRMSLITRLFFEGVPENKMNRAFESLIHTVGTYQEALPIEWSVRQCSRIKRIIREKEELLNLISIIGRFQRAPSFVGETNAFDCLDLLCDINTYQGTTKQRFTELDAADFLLNTAFPSADNLEKETGELLDG